MAQDNSPNTSDHAGSSRGSTRQRLLAVLATRHRYLAAVAEAIAVHGQRLRDRVINERVECATLIDDHTGAQLGGERGIAGGNAEEVVLDRLLVRREGGHRYVCVHTHPHSMPISLIDAAVLTAEAGARVIDGLVAVARDGTWYLLSVDPAQAPPTAEALRNAYGEAALATLADYSVPEGSSPALIAQARRGHMHAIWTRAAPALGLRYDRVTPARTTKAVQPAPRAGAERGRDERGRSLGPSNRRRADRGRQDRPSR